MKPSSDDTLPLAMKIAAAGLAGCTADLVTFPLDTMKVWLQVRGESGASSTAVRKLATPTIQPRQNSAAVKFTNEALKVPQRRQGLVSENALRRILPAVTAKFTARDSKSPIGKATHKGTKGSKRQVYSSSKIDNALKRKNATFTMNGLTMPALDSQKRVKSLIGKSSAGGGSLQTIISNLKTRGIRSLYSGLNAGLQRQIGFCSVRIGFYDNVKEFYVNMFPGAPGSKMVGQRILAGATTGIMAVCLFQPTEVVKIQMQAQRGRYSGTLLAYRHLYKVGGIGEMWKGLGANCTRTAVVNVCELVTYDMVKEAILKKKLMTDHLPCHFASALISGFITTVVASPVDVVKTRYMNSEKGTYKNPIQCATRMFQAEGFKAFYKGFIPSYLRLGSWNIVMFVSFEQYKRIFRTKTESLPFFQSEPKSFLPPNPKEILSVVQSSPQDTVYPSYIEAIFRSQYDAGPMP